jgi:hypothetical protein
MSTKNTKVVALPKKATSGKQQTRIPKADAKIMQQVLTELQKPERAGFYVTASGEVLGMETAGHDSLMIAARRAVITSRGYSTPYEEFVENILLDYSMGLLDRDRIADELNDLDTDLSYIKEDMETYAKLHPDLMSAALESAGYKVETAAVKPSREVA